MYVIYGIPNCDIIKKAITWFDSHKIPYTFHDYKKNGISGDKLKEWIAQRGIGIILNKRSTTWRELNAKTQDSASDEKKAIQLMMENTSLIKRPVIEKGKSVIAVGFNADEYVKLFKK